MAKPPKFMLTFVLFALSLVSNIFGQLIAPRLNAAAFEDGRTIWTLARYTDYNAYQSIVPQTAEDYQKMKSYTLPDVALCYDINRKLLFSLTNLSIVFTDENSLFFDLLNGDIAHLYVPLQSSQLNVQIYDKNGNPKGPSKQLFNVLSFSAAVSETQPATILIAYYIIDGSTGSAMYSLLNNNGEIVTNSTLIASKVFTKTNDTSYQPSIAASSTADGNFLVNWNGGINNPVNNNNQLIRAAYIQPGKPITQAFIVAMSNTNGFLRLTKCGTLRAGDGHYCIYDQWSAGSGAIRSYSSYITEFSFTGARYDTPATIVSTQNVNTSQIFETPISVPLPYGGMVVVTTIPQSGQRVSNSSLFNRNFISQPTNQLQIYYGPLAVLPKTNTVLSLAAVTSNVTQPTDWVLENWMYKVISQDVPKFLPDATVGNNPTINSTLPSSNDQIKTNENTLSITFFQNDYRYGIGNISIYSSAYSQYPREIIPVIPSSNQLPNPYIAKVSSFTFNTPATDYWITIDGGTFKSSSNEPLMGLRNGDWQFKTTSAVGEFPDKDDITLQLRLLPSAQPRDHDSTSQTLSKELSLMIPVESNRISCRYLRADHGGEIYQISLQRAHSSNGNNPASALLDYLNQMIVKKDTSVLSGGDATKYIDAQFGARVEENIFSKNRNIFIAGGVVIVVLIILYGICHRRFPESNNMILFILAVSLFNFIAYLMFVIFNSADVPYLRVPSIIFLILPFAFYMLSSTMIIVKEVSENPAFLKWFSRRTMITTMVSLLASINPVLLNILRSRFAGFNDLDAPFSDTVSKRILYCTAIGLVLSDLPHLIIQTLFKSSNGYFTLFPFLSMVSSILGILFSIIGHIYNHLAFKNHSKMKSKKGWDEMNDTQVEINP
ncbi:hypothetical protein K7432_007282 [Basidiobolus ranarum]|uniref:Uncharacterized protein n=1 Tax=Basidiobolus ranarum TaxID=34480 RepID=A0ABR2W0A2_9FUNG